MKLECFILGVVIENLKKTYPRILFTKLCGFDIIEYELSCKFFKSRFLKFPFEKEI